MDGPDGLISRSRRTSSLLETQTGHSRDPHRGGPVFRFVVSGDVFPRVAGPSGVVFPLRDRAALGTRSSLLSPVSSSLL